MNPLAKLAVKRYPPVGASQSSISPAQKTPGIARSIRCSSSASKVTPPALLIASSSGRGAISEIGSDLIADANSFGSEKFFLGTNSHSKPDFTPMIFTVLLRCFEVECEPRGRDSFSVTSSCVQSGFRSSSIIALPSNSISSRNCAEIA